MHMSECPVQRFFERMTRKAFKEYNASASIVGKLFVMVATPEKPERVVIRETNTPVKDLDISMADFSERMEQTKRISEKFLAGLEREGLEVQASLYIDPVRMGGRVNIIVTRTGKDECETRHYRVNRNRMWVGASGRLSGMNPFRFHVVADVKENEK